MDKIYKIKLKKDDTVVVRSGKYKGKTGKILRVHPKLNKVTIEGINVAKKHKKPTSQDPQGGIFEITRPIWVSKVGILDEASNKASRIGFSSHNTKDKKRVYKTSGREIKS